MPQRERKRNERIALQHRPRQRLRNLVPHALKASKDAVPPGTLVHALDGWINGHNAGQCLRKRWIDQRNTALLEHAPAGKNDLAYLQLRTAIRLIEPLEGDLAGFVLRGCGEHRHPFLAKIARGSADAHLYRRVLPVYKLGNRHALRIIQIISRKAKE
ncbi:hypothetical protein SDC9_195203 [bioreactor metagenome]|uniref:Uncharacterized protein n=1 Tax=bioreactor metagenome TaxID=1076179 RepID=A0A645I909_9ZZZZ